MEKEFIGNLDTAAIEELYARYRENPSAVDESWRTFFEGFDFARTAFGKRSGAIPLQLQKEFRVINLINGYRHRGHLFTDTNPVRKRRTYSPTLDLEHFGLDTEDLDTVFQAGTEIGIGPAPLRDIVAHLKQTYCASIGAEYKYVRSPEAVRWLERRMEGCRNTPSFSVEQKRRILQKLNAAVAFEHFLHTRYTGQKRFSLEGCETLIPALDAVLEEGAALGIREFVIGMAHRGRLNVLANVLGKEYEEIFTEFEGAEYDDNVFAGDVKYHLGFSAEVTTASGRPLHLSVTPNPSHLEAVDAVVQGMVRAKIDGTRDGSEERIAPILIHGDAALAAQGIVYEVIQMSQLKGFRTGGTIHLALNNQIGFTTDYIDGRSSTYCTDVAKVTLSPVFHVNADDVEALVYTIQLAMAFRQQFRRDVFIDILGYRKYGHNEGDEPRFTQPLLYKAIADHPDPRAIYTDKLREQGAIESDLAVEMDKAFRDMLQERLDQARGTGRKQPVRRFREGPWQALRASQPSDFDRSPDTSVPEATLLSLGRRLNALPDGKPFFRKIRKLFEERVSHLDAGRLDWAMGELLAYATLLEEGFPVRISGQDVERGTFAHRHAVVTLEDSEEKYIPLQHLSDSQAPFRIYNSPLSEYGVLGFEYGYGLSAPNSLVVWEAQFGDFGNGAQVIIDQYLAGGEDKWNRMNGLVLLLPHGYEGQGAEHSSARIERFLDLAAEQNLQLVNCTTPANFFHVLRRQLHRPFRKPLVVFTPKSLLRHPLCVSVPGDFCGQAFREVLEEGDAPADADKVIFCSGKVYYDLLEEKRRRASGAALVRIEQLYPFPAAAVDAVLKKYGGSAKRIWVQEEPENMGAWGYLLRTARDLAFEPVARPESASPATGSHKQHEKEQALLIRRAFE